MLGEGWAMEQALHHDSGDDDEAALPRDALDVDEPLLWTRELDRDAAEKDFRQYASGAVRAAKRHTFSGLAHFKAMQSQGEGEDDREPSPWTGEQSKLMEEEQGVSEAHSHGMQDANRHRLSIPAHCKALPPSRNSVPAIPSRLSFAEGWVGPSWGCELEGLRIEDSERSSMHMRSAVWPLDTLKHLMHVSPFFVFLCTHVCF